MEGTGSASEARAARWMSCAPTRVGPQFRRHRLPVLAGCPGRPGAHRAGEAYVEALEVGVPGAEPLGIHLEGPFINKEKKGAFNRAGCAPSLEEAEAALAAGRGWIRQITLAPELPGAGQLAALPGGGCRRIAGAYQQRLWRPLLPFKGTLPMSPIHLTHRAAFTIENRGFWSHPGFKPGHCRTDRR